MSAPPQSDPSADWTIGRLLQWTADFLTRQEVVDARLATEVLLAGAVGCRRIDLYARFDRSPDEQALARFRESVRRAATHEPVAYIVAEKEFFSLPFHVTRDVLIPRPETEVLVECVIDHCRAIGMPAPRLLDIGTGSGCIAVTLLTQIAGATVVATDVSEPALKLAARNAERHGVLDRLTPVEADLLALPGEVVPAGGFDVILSNPPYVAADSVASLHKTVREFEPVIALTDGGDGLACYRAIADGGPAFLRNGGAVFVEIDDGRAADVVTTMTQAGTLVHRRTWKDRVVARERVLMFVRKSEV